MTVDPNDYVSTRRVGDSTVTAIDEASGTWPLELTDGRGRPVRKVADADESGRVTIGFHVFHIQIGDSSILVDSGFDDPDTEWGRAFEAEWQGVRRSPGLTAGLASVGVIPDGITHILITHAHFDHIAGLTRERDGHPEPRFPNAEVFLGRKDWEENSDRRNRESEVARRVGTIDRHGLLRLVDTVTEVVPAVSMIPSPGESSGHCIVRVFSRGEAFFALGDLFHHTSEVEHLDWTSPWVNKEEMVASRKALLHGAGHSSATLAYTHHPFPPWGKVVEKDDGWEWERL